MKKQRLLIYQQYNIISAVSWLLCFLACILICAYPFIEPEAWSALAMGKDLFNNFRIIKKDVFSFASYANTWQCTTWLYDISLYLFFRLTGYSALSLIKIPIAIIIPVLFFILSYMRKWNFPIAAGFSAFFLFLFKDLIILRPQLIGIILFIIFLLLITQWRHKRKISLILPLPFLMALWVNIHHSFITGCLFLALFFLIELFKKIFSASGIIRFQNILGAKSLGFLFIITAASILASLANPYGTGIFQSVFTKELLPALFSLKEWYVFERVRILSILLMVIPFIFVCMIFISSRHNDAADLLLLIISFILIFFARKYAVFFFILCVVYGIKYTSILLNFIDSRGFFDEIHYRYIGPGSIILFFILIFTLSFTYKPKAGFYNLERLNISSNLSFYPFESADFIKTNKLPTNIYSPAYYGGFMFYQLYPQYKYFIEHKNMKINEIPLLKDLMMRMNQTDWTTFASNFNIKTALIRLDHKSNSYSSLNLSWIKNISQKWRLAFWDDKDAVYTSDNIYSPFYFDPVNINELCSDDIIKRYEIKRELLKRSQIEPSSAWCSVYLAAMHAGEANTDTAYEYINIACSIDSSNPNIILYRYIIDFIQNPDKLIDLKKYIFASGISYLKAADILIGMKQYKNALRIFTEFEKFAYLNYKEYMLKAICIYNTGNLYESMEYFNKALKLSPHNPDILYNSALAYLHHEKITDSTSKIQELLNSSKGSTIFKAIAAETYFKIGNDYNADYYARQVLNVLPEDFESLYIIGKSAIKDGNFAEAEKYLNKALNLRKNNERTLLALTELFIERKDYTKAGDFLNMILDEWFLESPEYLFLISRLKAYNSDLDGSFLLLNKAIASGGVKYKVKAQYTVEFKALIYKDNRFYNLLK